MNEEEIQQRRREQDEQSTQHRASLLGLRYLDTREIEQTIGLVRDVLSVEDMHANRMVPLEQGDEERSFQFGITAQTPESGVGRMRREYNEDGKNVDFMLISLSGYRALMERYDPPKQVIYDDIQIGKEGDSDTIASVSQTLNSVRSEELFDFIVRQADKLGASDIQIENERESIRVRFRVDGALHAVAHLDKDRYRVIMGELASRAGVSTAAAEAQSGHMQEEITTEQGTHLHLRHRTPRLHLQGRQTGTDPPTRHLALLRVVARQQRVPLLRRILRSNLPGQVVIPRPGSQLVQRRRHTPYQPEPDPATA